MVPLIYFRIKLSPQIVKLLRLSFFYKGILGSQIRLDL